MVGLTVGRLAAQDVVCDKCLEYATVNVSLNGGIFNWLCPDHARKMVGESLEGILEYRPTEDDIYSLRV